MNDRLLSGKLCYDFFLVQICEKYDTVQILYSLQNLTRKPEVETQVHNKRGKSLGFVINYEKL